MTAGFLLAACASPAVVRVADSEGAWRKHQQRLSPVSTWDFHGRVAMRTESDGWHGSLEWKRYLQREVINIRGPLGGGQLRLTRDEHGAELRDAKRQQYYDTDARRLIHRTTGWDMPIEALHYWIIGIPDPEVKNSYDLDDLGRLKRLSQHGWEVEFIEYGSYRGVDLPSKLVLRRQSHAAGSANNKLELRLIIKAWNSVNVAG
jgi:outer membrane lipoprotein LolB